MLDLSTINATTIAAPATIQAVGAEVRRLRERQDSVQASVLRTYLERQLAGGQSAQLHSQYQAALNALAEISEPLKEPAERSEEIGLAERVPVRDNTGRVRFFQNGAYLAEPAGPTTPAPPPPEPPAESRRVPDTARIQQVSVGMSSDRRPVPVAYDSPEDEEEIRRHADRLSTFQLDDTHDIDSIIARIVTANQLVFSDEPMAKRFRTIAESRLKDIRSSREVRELLVRPPKIGGLGLESAKADAVITALEQSAVQVRDSRPTVQPKVMVPQSAPTPTPPKIPVITPNPPPVQPRPIPPVPPPPPKRSLPIRQAPSFGSRPVIADIRPPATEARLVGPTEELTYLTPEDFRRWGGGDATASVRKVYEKIVLLGEESFSRRVEGVRAWRESPVYQLYLTMSQESLEQGKDFREILKAREAARQPTLTEAEFHAIVDLNRQLRF